MSPGPSSSRGPGRRTIHVLSALAAGALLLPGRADAQFGRNKVQYEAREFRIIETLHFDLYYYDEEREAAVDAARMAERIYGRLSRILDHEFRDRKPIILYASQTDFQQTNVLAGRIGESTGGVTESLKDRVLLPLTGSYAELQHVLAHELVHSFQFDILRRSAVETSASPFAFFPSLWFMEGMAEYLSIGKIDAKTAAWVRDAVLDGYLRTIPEMDRFNDFLSYRFGQSLWNYIGRRWGDETVGVLLKRSAVMGIERGFRRTLGITIQELSDQWHEAVRATVLPQVRRANDLERMARRITSHRFARGRGKSASYVSPALSPDGSELVYLSDLGYDLYTFMDLYLADARTGKPLRRLVKSARGAGFESLRYLTSSAEFAPDGDRVAFVAKSGGRDALYVIDVRSGRIERKFTPSLNGLQSPSWSPDGSRIVFTGLLGGISDLYVWDLRTDGVTRLTSDRYARLHPVWSPDGRTIAFSTDEGPEADFERLVFAPFRIALLDLETGDVEILSGLGEGESINPAWSPDGRTIAFLSTRTGVFNVFLFDLDDRSLRQVTDVLTGTMGDGALLTSPALTWARKADRIAFSVFEEAGHNIYTIDDPRRVAGPPLAAAPVRTAASQIGRPRLIESRHGGDAKLPRDGDTPSSFYLTPEGFRRSDFDPAALAAQRAESAAEGQLSVAALMDSAMLALPDTTSFQLREYGVRLTPDLVGRPQVGAQVGGFFGNGVYGGSSLVLSDMLGNHNMVVAGDIQGSFDNARLFTSYTYLKNRTNFGISFVQFPFFRFLGRQFGPIPGKEGEIGDFNVFQRDRFRSVSLNGEYPFSGFARLEMGLSASSIQTDLVFQGISRTTFRGFTSSLDGRTRAFIQPTIAYVYDNSLPGFTGPMGGRRFRLEASPSVGDLNLGNFTADVRSYVPLVGPFTIANRLLSFTRVSLNDRDDAREFEFAWGGPYFLRGFDFGSFGFEECRASQARSRSGRFCPAQAQLIGSSILLLNSEIRFPILNAFNASWLPLDFPPIDGAFFYDLGLAFTPGVNRLVWNRKPGQDIVRVREPLASYGVGLRVNIFFAIIRLDYTVAPSRRSGAGNGIWSVAVGEMF